MIPLRTVVESINSGFGGRLDNCPLWLSRSGEAGRQNAPIAGRFGRDKKVHKKETFTSGSPPPPPPLPVLFRFLPPPSSDRFSDRGQYRPTLVEDADFCLLIFETAKIVISASDLRKPARTPSDEHAVRLHRRHCQSNPYFSDVEKLSRYEILTALYT